MLYNKKKGSTRKKLGSFFGSIADRFSMDVMDLIWAVDKNDTEKVRRAMQAGLDPNRTDGIERRALPMAVDQLNEEMISYLLQGGADPNLLGMDGESSLYKAVTWGHEPIVKMLLQAGGNPNQPIAEGVTPLQAAKNMGSKSMMNLLTNPATAKPKPEKKPKPIPKPKKTYTSPETERTKTTAAKNIAIGKKAEEAAKKMKGAAQKAKEIIERKAKEAAAKKPEKKAPTPKKTTTKPVATKKPKVAATKPKETPKPTLPKKKPVTKKAAAVIPYIKEAGSVAGALVMAIQKDNDAAIAALLTQIKVTEINKADKKGITPLLAAIENKHANATGALIDKGADVLAVSSKKEHSPLSLAVSMKSLNLVKFIIEKSDPELLKKALNNKKQLLSAQFLAYNQPKILNILLGAGADPNFGGKEGTSPLLKGMEKGSIGLLPLYAKHAIDLNQVVEGKSLIEWAIKYNRQDWINGLIMEGADIKSNNKNGQTPLEYAESFGEGRKEIVKILKKN